MVTQINIQVQVSLTQYSYLVILVIINKQSDVFLMNSFFMSMFCHV